MIEWTHPALKPDKKASLADDVEMTSADLDAEVCEGNVQLRITPFESFSQVSKYKKYLETIKDIKVISDLWSEEDGFSIIVTVKVPVALGRLLLDIPEVACVRLDNVKQGRHGHKQDCRKMVVVMKTTEESSELVPA